MIAFKTDARAAHFRLRSAGLNFAPMAVFFVVEAICAAATPGYSYVLHDISFVGFTACFQAPTPEGGLGELCPQLDVLFNLALMIAGFVQVLGLVTSWTLWPGKWLTRAALALLGLGAVLLFLVGFFPWNVQPRIHTLSASGNFLVTGLGLVLLGAALNPRTKAGGLTLALGLLSLVGLVLYTIGGGPVRGLVERLAAYPQILWYSFAGIVMLRAARRGS